MLKVGYCDVCHLEYKGKGEDPGIKQQNLVINWVWEMKKMLKLLPSDFTLPKDLYTRRYRNKEWRKMT